MVPVVIYPGDRDHRCDEQRQDDNAQLRDMAPSIKDGYLPGEVPRQEPQAGEGPCHGTTN